MEPGFILDQMDRLRSQAERETDPTLHDEHRKTLQHLHKQFRKATKHRNPWFGLLRILVTLSLVFLAVLWTVTKLAKAYGWENAASAGAVAVVSFIVITVTMLVLLKVVSPEIYSSVIGDALSTIRTIAGKDDSPEKLSVEVESSAPQHRGAGDAQHTPDAPGVAFDMRASELPDPDIQTNNKP